MSRIDDTFARLSQDGGKAFVDRIMTGFLIILGALTVVFTVAAPLVMSIYTDPRWRTEANSTTVSWTQPASTQPTRIHSAPGM